MTGRLITVSGTEMARKFPPSAARLVIHAWREGGNVQNAWDVLCSAYDVRVAADLVATYAGEDAAGVLESLGVVS